MKKLILSTISVAMVTLAFAQGPGHQRTHIAHHARVNQVNRRIDRQESRIDNKRADANMSHRQARADRTDLKDINREKSAMRRQDNGHLTKSDQRALNSQLNHDSKHIRRQ